MSRVPYHAVFDGDKVGARRSARRPPASSQSFFWPPSVRHAAVILGPLPHHYRHPTRLARPHASQGFLFSSRYGIVYSGLIMVSDLIAHELAQPYPAFVRLIGVKVRNRGEVKKLNAGSVAAGPGDPVILEHDGELTYGIVHTDPYTVPFSPPMRVMKSVLRVPTVEELAVIRRQPSLSREGIAFCREQTAALGLRMKMVEVYAALDRRQITFVYTADDRIDFRELVRILARRFHSRIEMRQIGAREEAKRLGGVDTCGLVLCCASFLTDFQPVSIKQARKLGVPVDDPKLLGVCGRLKCCLMFEAMEANSLTIQPSRLISPSPSSPVSA